MIFRKVYRCSQCKSLLKVLGILLLLCMLALCLCACTETAPPEAESFTVQYLAGIGGKIEGFAYQTVLAGENPETVKAIPDEGYIFVKWSDGVTDDTRTDRQVTADISVTALFEKIVYNIEYAAGEHGFIEGDLCQNVEYLESGSTVTAIPNKGFVFAGWSDGLETPTRQESEVKENKELTAQFEILTQTYLYEYKFANGDCDSKEVTLAYGQLEFAQLAVPKREHCTFGGWYADRYLTTRVTNERGNIVLDNELFDGGYEKFYAKWIGENKHPYKILIVYVTELNAELRTTDKLNTIQVNYKMSETEYEICEMVTEKFNFELNDLAVADFVVDEYFTTAPLTNENVQEVQVFGGIIDNRIWPSDIPEVQDKLDDYDSILVSFSMDDYFGDLSMCAGVATAQHGIIHFDENLSSLVLRSEPFESLLDPLYHSWDHFIDTYMHEFAHTIEQKVNDIFEYHKVISTQDFETRQADPLKITKLYFLNKAVVDGKTVGIPYEFWEGKVATVHYEPTYGGWVIYVGTHHNPTFGQNYADDIQYVLYGRNAIAVQAVATMSNYEFVEWSDGIKTATRQDFNIIGDMHVYAIFKKIDSA